MNTPKPSILTRSIAALLAVGAIHQQALALNGTWSNLNGGSWPTTTNWTGGTVAAGIDTIADFSTINITAARTVTLDGARTVGTLKFGDATTASHDWTLNTGTGGPLTLDVSSGFATINVVNRTVTIGAVLAGSDGINVTGNPTLTSGTVVFNAANTFTGGLRISGAIAQLNNATGAGANTITIATATNTASANRLQVNGGVTIANNVIIESGVSPLGGFGAINYAGTGQAVINGTITINGSVANGGHLVGGATGTVGNELVIGGALTSSVPLTQREGRVIYRGVASGFTTMTTTGAVILGASNVLPSNVALLITNTAGGTAGSLELGNFNQTIASLNIVGGSQGTVSSGTGVLTLNGALTSSGNFTHALNGNIDLNGATRNFTVNNGTNELDLVGSASISNGTLNKLGAGTFAPTGSISAPVTVTAGTLGGTATYGNTVTVDTGTTLAPASSITVGTITANTLAFGAGTTTVRMKIGAGGDAINSTTLTTAGGTTTFELNQLGGILPNGTYPLISYTGTSPGLTGFTVAPVGHAQFTTIDTGTAIAIQVTGNDRVIWDGTNTPAWATGATGNWKLQSNAAATDFITADEVIFQDSPTASAVSIAASVSPSKVSFTNTTLTPYTVTGSATAGIVGTTGLTKTGDGSVVLDGANTFSGATAVTDGTLEIVKTTAASNLSATSGVTLGAAATLRLSSANVDFTFDRAISGNGTVTIDPNTGGTAGSRVVTISGNNTGFSGLWKLSPTGAGTNGTFRTLNTATTPTSLGTAAIQVDNGGQLWLSNNTYVNNITISGTGYSEVAGGTPVGGTGLTYGGIGAIRIDGGSTLAGTLTLNGNAKIMSYNATATVSGAVGVTNPSDLLVIGGGAQGTTIIFTGANNISATPLNDIWINSGGTAGIQRLNIGNGGTTGTLGVGSVTIHGDAASSGVLGFDRSDGYTLGQGVTADGTFTTTFVDFDTTGAGFSDNGNAITLGLAAPASGGGIRLGQSRANTVTNLTGTMTAEKIQLGGVAAGTNAVMNIGATATITANFFTIGEAANATGGVVNQTGGAVNVEGQLRAGHFGTLTATYNMSGGTLTLTGASPNLTPSTLGGGGANATGDNNINALATNTIVGGGIYLGNDGTGILNHTGGTVTTNWIVLDNRVATLAGGNMADGIDRYNLSGAASILNLRSNWGLIGRNEGSYVVSFGGGTVRVDETGTGTGTGAGITIPLDATIDTVASTTTVLDTNGAGNGFTLTKDVRGTGTLNLTGGGTINVSTAGNQNIAATLNGSNNLTKIGTGTTTLSGNLGAYTGSVTVSAGRLNLPGSVATAVTVADGAALGGEPTGITALTLGTATGSTVIINPNTAGALTTATLTVNGQNFLDISALPLGAGPWTAINYTAPLAGGGTFAVLNAANYRTAPVVTDTGTAITLNITGGKSLTWTGAASTAWNINSAINWNDTTPAADVFFSGDTVNFPEGGLNPSIALTGPLAPFAITVDAATTAYTFTSTAGNQITGVTGLTKTNNGTLTLAGANAYNGPTSIGGGTVIIDGTNSIGSGASGNTLAISGGGRLSHSAAIALDLGVNRSLALGAGGGAISHNNATAATITLAGNLTGSGTDNLSFHSAAAGAGTFVLSGDNSGFTGRISIDAPAAAAGGLTGLRIASQSAVPAGGSITLNFPAAGAVAGNATTLDLPNVTLPAAMTLNMTSGFNGANSMRTQVTGSGTSIINGPVTLAGTSIIQFSANAAASMIYNGNFTETTPGAFNNVVFFRGAGTHTINGTFNLPTAGSTISVTDGATAIVNTTGNVFSTASSLFGTLRLGVNDALSTTANLIIGQAGDQAATLDMNGFDQTVSTLSYAAPTTGKGISNSHPTATSTLTVNQAADTSFNGVFSGRVNLVKGGANKLTLTGASTNVGSTTILTGVLALGNVRALGAAGNNVTVTSGATLDVGGQAGTGNRVNVTVSGTGVAGQAAIWNSGAGATNSPIYSSITLAGDTTVGGVNRYDLNAANATSQQGVFNFNGGTFTLTKVGANESWWAPSAGATVGNIVVDGGTFGVQSSGNLGSDLHKIVVNTAGSLTTFGAQTNSKPIELNGGQLAQNNNTTSTWTGSVTLTGAGTSNRIGTIATGTGVTLTGQVTGTGGFEKIGTGVLELQNATNDYAGDTKVSTGTLRVVGNDVLSPASTLDMNGGTVQLNGTDQLVAGLKGATGTVTGGGVLTIDQAVNTTYSGSITTAMTVTKKGAGVLTLNGIQTYSTLNVDAGGVNLDSALGTGASTLDVDGAVNISGNQTLASLVIGAGGVVTIGGPALAPEAPGIAAGFEGGAFDQPVDAMTGGAATAAVPEPGSVALLMAGALGFLGRRRRTARD